MNRFWDQVLRGVTEAARPRRLAEIGVAEGLLTQHLLDYCAATGAVLHAIDPQPQIDVEDWRARHGKRLIFHQARSLEVLGGIHDLDAVFLDGDHNWFTVYHELKLLGATAGKEESPPLIALHDIDWPYGRRDMYYDPTSIPDAHRQPYQMLGVVPGTSALAPYGINWNVNNAVNEGSVHNGVRTAFEDFVTESQLDWKLFHVPGFHGLGIAVTHELLSKNERLNRVLKSLRTSRFLVSWAEELELARVREAFDRSRQLSIEHDRYSAATGALEDERNRLQNDRHRLNELLVDAERRLASVPDLELRIADLERELKKAHSAAEDAHRQIEKLDERLTRGQRVLTDVFSSPSWRLTKPLRTAKHLLNRD